MNLKRTLLTAGLVAMMSLGFASGALVSAEEVTKTNEINVTINGGGLHLETSDIHPFGEIEIKPTPQTYYTSFLDKLSIKDLRGSLAGWRLAVSATPFTQTIGYEAGGTDPISYSLPYGSLTISGVERVEPVGDGTFGGTALPEPELVLQSNAVIDDGSHVVIARSEYGGSWDLFFPDNALGLTIDPATALAGEYESTITWHLFSVPYERHL